MSYTNKRKAIQRYHHSERGRFSRYKSIAKALRGLEVTLTFEQYQTLRQQKCLYCDGDLPRVMGGIDRADNSKGYTPENCVPCCRECNRVKGAKYTKDQMLEIGVVLKRFNTL